MSPSARRLELGTDASLFLYRDGKVFRLTLEAVDDRKLERALAAHLSAPEEPVAPVAAAPTAAAPVEAAAPPSQSSPSAKAIDCPKCWCRAVPAETLDGGRVRCGHCRAAIPAMGASPRGRMPRSSRKVKEPDRVNGLSEWSGALRAYRRSLGIVGAVALAVGVCAFFPFHLLTARGQSSAYPARGEVTFEGRPLPGAAIVLHPREGDAAAPRPRATANADGRFDLSTSATVAGIPAGEYLVTVQCYPPPSGKDDGVVPRNILPDRYAHPDTSGLTLRIEAGDNQLAPLRLKR